MAAARARAARPSRRLGGPFPTGGHWPNDRGDRAAGLTRWPVDRVRRRHAFTDRERVRPANRSLTRAAGARTPAGRPTAHGSPSCAAWSRTAAWPAPRSAPWPSARPGLSRSSSPTGPTAWRTWPGRRTVPAWPFWLASRNSSGIRRPRPRTSRPAGSRRCSSSWTTWAGRSIAAGTCSWCRPTVLRNRRPSLVARSRTAGCRGPPTALGWPFLRPAIPTGICPGPSICSWSTSVAATRSS